MRIRKTQIEDFEKVQDIYAYAREQMRKNGNPTQWGENRPPKDSIRKDILEGNHYVMEEDGEIVAVFSFIVGEDPTYLEIEDGQWLNDLPYGTIHKLAAGSKGKGIFQKCLDFCRSICDEIRVDTHKDNLIMQKLAERNGFVRCGIIYVDDGTPRIAYQLKKQDDGQE